jgi:hypothetical protein
MDSANRIDTPLYMTDFQAGDLVQVLHGNNPLGIIRGDRKPRYSAPNAYGPRDPKANYYEWAVIISDMEETLKYERWYWPGGLIDYWGDRNKQHDALTPFIHASFLKFLARP